MAPSPTIYDDPTTGAQTGAGDRAWPNTTVMAYGVISIGALLLLYALRKGLKDLLPESPLMTKGG